MRFKLSKER
jgi:hypothetical protein